MRGMQGDSCFSVIGNSWFSVTANLAASSLICLICMLPISSKMRRQIFYVIAHIFLLWTLCVEFVTAVSAESTWYSRCHGWKKEIICLQNQVRVLSSSCKMRSYGLSLQFSATSAHEWTVYGWNYPAACKLVVSNPGCKHIAKTPISSFPPFA